jgi:hypothetical protein
MGKLCWFHIHKNPYYGEIVLHKVVIKNVCLVVIRNVTSEEEQA